MEKIITTHQLPALRRLIQEDIGKEVSILFSDMGVTVLNFGMISDANKFYGTSSKKRVFPTYTDNIPQITIDEDNAVGILYWIPLERYKNSLYNFTGIQLYFVENGQIFMRIGSISDYNSEQNKYNTVTWTEWVELTNINENIIETIKVNGTEQTVTNKTINIKVPTKISDLTNDSNFLTSIPSEYITDTELNAKNYITNSVNNLTNYYTSSKVDELIEAVSTFNAEIVDSLPATGETTKIYLVRKTNGSGDNIYNEYVYINSAWELIGDTQMDVSNKQDKLTIGNGINISNTNEISVDMDAVTAAVIAALPSAEESEF